MTRSRHWHTTTAALSALLIVVGVAAVGVVAPAQATPAGGSRWLTVANGGHHTCGIQQGGSLWCWGDNQYGQVGVGETTNRNTPTQVGVNTDWVTVAANDDSTCAIPSSGSLSCWGVGVGRNSTIPVQIGSSQPRARRPDGPPGPEPGRFRDRLGVGVGELLLPHLRGQGRWLPVVLG